MEYRTVSICIIGTELTRGVITDKHGSMLASSLSRLGYDVEAITIVPDDGTIAPVLEESVKGCDVLIVTGGLGPTSDDLTRSSIAKLAGVPLVQDKSVYDWLYKKVGERIHGANLAQTMFPEGFLPIDNPNGTAPGFRGIIPSGEKEVVCIAMPGPPREMDPMFQNLVVPYLVALRGHDDTGRDEYSVFLIGESKLEELCEQVGIDGVAWGTRFQDYRISLYLTGEEGRRKAFASRLKELTGPCLVVDGDHEAVSLLEDRLSEGKRTVTTAESCTGGLVGKLLTDKAGSSAWFWGGALTYANEAKRKMLGVSEGVLSSVGPVSEECALAMAEGIRTESESDLSISTTGFAGPTGEDVGKVWFGFAGKGMEPQAVCLHFTSYGRDSVRRKAAVASFLLASAFLDGVRLLDIVCKWQYI